MMIKMLSLRRIAAAAASLVLLSLAVAACQVPDRPAWWPKEDAAGAAKLAGTSSVPVLRVAKPWAPGMRQLGIDIYWVANTADSATVVRAKARRIINYAVKLHANSISVSFPFYTYGVKSNAVYRSAKTTPTPQEIGIFLDEAQKSRMRTMLRPILNEDVLYSAHAWRGSIQPTNRAAWFTSYRQLLVPYAKVGATGHLTTLVVGTELNSLETDSHWAGLVSAVRAVYKGQVAYDENTSDFQAHDNHLPLATFGVDAWPHIQLPDSATVTQLTDAWSKWLGTHTLAVRRKAILTEVGIRAMAGAYPNPAKWNGIGTPKIVTRVQTNWFRALCGAVQREHMGGIYWWEVSYDADPANPSAFQTDPFTYLGRPAQDVVNNCFTRLTSLPNP